MCAALERDIRYMFHKLTNGPADGVPVGQLGPSGRIGRAGLQSSWFHRLLNSERKFAG